MTAPEVIIAAGKCQVSFDNVDATVAWVRAVFGLITPEAFVKVMKVVLHPNPEMLKHIQDMARQCLGTSV